MKFQRGLICIRFLTRFLFFFLLACYCYKITPPGPVQDSVLIFSKKILVGQWGFNTEIGECYERNGKYFPAYSPLYSITPVPLVFLSGNRIQFQHLNLLAVLATAVLLWFYMRSRLSLRSYADVSVVLFLLATPMVHNIREGNVWHFMHTISNFFLITALIALRHQRWFIFGFSLGYASMVRMALIPGAALSTLVLFAYNYKKKAFNMKGGILLILGIAVPVILTLFLQFLMTGCFFKSPYEVAWEQWGQHRKHGTLSLYYLPENLAIYFGQLPCFLNDFPWIQFDGYGQSLWWLCPWLFSAFFARFEKLHNKTMICIVLPTILFYLCYYYSGYHQFGTRYWTDFMVLWIILALQGWNRLFGGFRFLARNIFFRAVFVFFVFWSFVTTNYISFLWGKINF